MNERSIFAAAMEITDPLQRAAYLNQACGEDTSLRQHLEGLLAEHEQLGSFLAQPLASPPFALEDRLLFEGVGTKIGPYKLLQQIGEGGMGVVYMAEQETPVRRKVALKIIKLGIDSAQVVARFEAERQALALMDHANIARVIDASTTASGRPYFVMELVYGVPITRYCDENQLTPRERLELFIPVCRAIQHAHQKGIIHRDIKPSNIMVTLSDDKPMPKVIDFGVAKAIEQRLTDKTLFTQYGAIIGTLEYMSPEQAEFHAADVDTRADVYSLGVLLYELLTGTTPISRDRLKRAPVTELLRLIREEEPPTPSTRISESKETLASISAQRRLEPARLTRELRGDLDWIVMRCLEKDRAGRYETVNGLARDIQRYLADEPVEASPPSAFYRLRKFVRRNKPQVAAASLLVLALVAAIAFGIWHNRQLDRKNRDLLAANEATRQAKQDAEQREAETKAVLDFVENKIFAAARPERQAGGLGREVTLRRALQAALSFVDQSFPDQPLIEARLRHTLAVSFANLGEAKIATDQIQTARTIYLKHLGPDHPSTLASTLNLASVYRGLGRHADALKLGEETLARMRDKLDLDHPHTLACMNNLAISYDTLGRHADALKLHEEALALRRARLGPADPRTLASMNNLAGCYSNLGRHADALELSQKTVALAKATLGPDHPDTLRILDTLAQIYRNVDRHREAIKLYEEVVALMKIIFGPGHSHTLGSMNSLAELLATCPDARLRDPKRAVELAMDAVELAPQSARAWQVLGWARYRTGAWKDSIAALEKSIELREDGGDSFRWFFLAMAHWQVGHKDQARKWYGRAAEWADKNLPADAQLRRFRAEAAELLGLNERK